MFPYLFNDKNIIIMRKRTTNNGVILFIIFLGYKIWGLIDY